MSTQWTSDGSFRNKPVSGWIHSDFQLYPDSGIIYPVIYIGAIEIFESIKTIEFSSRTKLIQECIHLVCAAGGIKLSKKDRKKGKDLQHMLRKEPTMNDGGCNCKMQINVEKIELRNLDIEDHILGVYPLNSISFTSCGDSDTSDFFGLIAKDTIKGRLCYVFECGVNSAEDILRTIGQAFELRYKQHIGMIQSVGSDRAVSNIYVPDASAPFNDNQEDGDCEARKLYENEDFVATCELIDDNKADNKDKSPSIDLFGMRPFNSNNNVNNVSSTNDKKISLNSYQEMEEKEKPIGVIGAGDLTNEIWYHGLLTRDDVAKLLEMDGDFLVRAATNDPGQYVLSGKHNDRFLHLLLVDPTGVVRTKTQTFNSISHLIRHHLSTGNPISTHDGHFILIRPISAK